MSVSPRRIAALSEKELHHILRDPRSLYLALGMPVVMILLFGFGVSFDLERIPITVVDRDQSGASAELSRRLLASGEFSGRALPPQTDAEVSRLLIAGEAIAVVILDRDFERALRRGDRPRVQVLLDGADANSASQTRTKLETTIGVLGASLVAPAGAKTPALGARTWTRFNPEGRSAVFLVPGIAAFVLAMVAVLLTALTIAREWERGSMAQLFATPVGRLDIVLGKLLPYVVLGALAVLLVVAVGMWVFDVPFRGSALALGVLSLLFLVGMLGQGLLISVVTKNQMVATQVATMSSMLPAMLLSGFLFPIENMPTVLRWLTSIIPARYYVEGLRGILLRGNGLAELWPQALALSAFSVGVITLSTLRFKRRIA